GDGARLRGVRYVLTLDADTRLCAGSARELIGAMLHPSARAVVDPVRRAVTRGYGILQPRVSTELGAATRSEFARAFSGDGGLDPYGGAPGDLYSALTGCGSFIGKGIFDVDAYLACLGGRFPENAVLSHDLLEGAYLRCGFAGDVELTDGAPASPDAHYARLHRWTRGDWQSAPWIFARGLTAMDRWKLADNLRRSLLPIAAAACLAYAGLTGAAGLAGLAILALVFGDVLRLLGGLPRLRDFGRRYFSYVPEGGGAPLARCFTRLLLLPADASVCAAAIVTALWRMLVTRRKMLEWTPAADMDARRGGLLRAYRTALPALILAGGVLCFTRYPPAAAFALVWLLSPLYFYALGRDAARQAETPRKTSDDAALREYAGRIWRYFDDFLRPEDNFLPPDNLRETPEATLTRKTSPTNIGLALTSCLAALDLGLATRERALFLIERTLGTLERLEKWRGHLYNWYDTATRAPMEPRYVSSVDSGNLAAALAALREGLAELGAGELARRAETLCRAMDFAPLYDAKRRLLRIGWDASAGTYSEGAYDLLASEAMLTSYLAVARGDVPRRHWRALSRAQLGKNGYRGCASWTGTMFEYLMPFLFLPCPRHSLLYENARFCVYIHERAKKRTRGVWGMSESAFYAPNLTRGYPYKAHGARELALKRGMERDAVAAPYASFLALMVSPRRALANLRRLETLGAAGEYGFREALDFTEERVRKNPEVVRSYMAHHLGMSLAAIDNHLCGGILRERFARDPEVRAHLELLSERVPRGGRTLKNPREVPERRARVPESARRGGEPGGEDHKIKLTQI
ncbi:MAG: hypothetical protein LBT36_02880, partial [Oscillospiraceae bacterium]|nr:hypothetical protein [Oscillospiraceae bacterium]